MRRRVFAIAVVCLLSCTAIAQTSADVSTDQLQAQLSQLSSWLGEWHCDGKFVKTGKPISSTLRLSSALQGRWIELRQDDLPPNRFHAVEYWGYDEKAGNFVASVFDNFNPMSRVFEAKPIDDGVLTWSRDLPGSPASAEQFIFESASSKLKITYQVLKGGSWTVGDVLTCTRR